MYLRELHSRGDHSGLQALDLTFVLEGTSVDAEYASREARSATVELKPGGAEQEVTLENLAEYLQLYAEERLVGEIRPQIDAFREGLGVFVNDEVGAQLRQLCTVADVQVLLCGEAEIDVDDWEEHTDYNNCTASTPQVGWFWETLRSMSSDERSLLLAFCTGSARAPGGGFGALMGYQGGQHRFTLEVCGAEDGADSRLPTASTCINTLRLPCYSSQAALSSKLRQAVLEGGKGFAFA